MKKIPLLLLLLLISSNSFGQDKKQIKNAFKLNALPLFTGFYEFQYERLISEKGSIKIGFGTGTLINRNGDKAEKDFMEAFGSNGFNNNEHVVEGFTVNADYRYFFTNTLAPEGLYISPGIQYLKLNEKYTYTNSENEFSTLVDNDYSIFNIRGLFGYQFIIANTIVLNPYLGAGITLGSAKGNNNSRVNSFGAGFSVNGGIDIGIGF